MIGVIDSGIGGKTIFEEIKKLLPNEEIIYLNDSKNFPYGNKTTNEIYTLSKILVRKLIKKKVKVIVIACNTITVACVDRLREDFPSIAIVGTVPAIKLACRRFKRVGILSTVYTARSSYQKNLIKRFATKHRVVNRGTNMLAPRIEQGFVPNSLLRSILKPFRKCEVLVLGCTHFSLIKKEIQKVLDIPIIDSSSFVAKQVKRIILTVDKTS